MVTSREVCVVDQLSERCGSRGIENFCWSLPTCCGHARRVDQSVKHPSQEMKLSLWVLARSGQFRVLHWRETNEKARWQSFRFVTRMSSTKSESSGGESCRGVSGVEGGVHTCRHDCEGSVKVGVLVLHHDGTW